MSETKVLFHPLERLDLIDVDALQTQVLDYLAQVTGNILGRDQFSAERVGGVLAKPSTTTVVNGAGGAYTINFSDFTFLEMNTEAGGRSRQARVTTYDASDSFHGVCDFSAARQVIQLYYNAGGALPPVGGQSVVYQESVHGAAYYPFVWVRSAAVTATTDTRRFWSVTNGQEITSTVATRSDKAVEFAVRYTSPAGEWVKVARVVNWSLSGSTVELQPSGIVFFTLTDSVLPLPTFGGGVDEYPSYYEQYSNVNDAADFSGLLACFKAVQNELSLLRSSGTFDATYGSTSTNMTRLPRLSLDGLYDRTTDLQAQLTETRQIGSAVFTLEANRPAGEYNLTVTNNTVVSTAYPRVTLAGNADLSMLFNKVNPPSTPVDYAGVQFAPQTSVFLNNWHSALSMFTVEVPSSFDGYEIRINPVIVSAYVDDFNANNATSFDAIGSTNEKFAPITAHLVTDAPSGSGDYSDIMRVGLRERKDESNSPVSFYGVRVALAGIDQLLTATQVQLYKVRVAVKVDVELVEI